MRFWRVMVQMAFRRVLAVLVQIADEVPEVSGANG